MLEHYLLCFNDRELKRKRKFQINYIPCCWQGWGNKTKRVMKYYYKNNPLESIDNLKENTKNWRDSKSAASIGEFVFQHNGIEHITDIVNRILENTNNEAVENFDKAKFEHETKFDKLGQGRMHDLALFGTTNNGKSVFVGIEAKVNEGFDTRDIQSAYLSGMLEHVNNRNSNITSRVEDLIRRNNFKEQKRGKDAKTINNRFSKEQLVLKYQLLYSTIGTAVEDADICILLVLVFKTDLYNEICGADNYRDYIAFMNAITSERISENMDLRKVEVFTDDALKNKKTIYAAYEYISAKGWNKN